MRKISMYSVVALTATLLLGSSSAYAANDVSVQSSDNTQQCMDVSTQEKDNEAIKNSRTVWPMLKGEFSQTSSYGSRISPLSNTLEVHTGSDMAGPDLTPIRSIAKGVVKEAGPTFYLGQWVVIEHNYDGQIWTSVYGHLTAGSQIVKPGDIVEPGQIIAKEGMTGNSTGPHLHLEIWSGEVLKGHHVDPLPWLASHNIGYFNDPVQTKPLDCGQSIVTDTGNVKWGNHENGQIPNDALCALDFNAKLNLECDAAKQMNALNADFKKHFNHDMPITNAYENLDMQSKDEKSNTLPGKSYFGWAKSVELNFDRSSNVFIPLIAEPDPFTDVEYLWLAEKGKDFGWKQSPDATKTSTTPDAGKWVYAGNIKNADSAAGYQSLALATSITKPWNNDKNRQCLINLWNNGNKWNSNGSSNGAMGIANMPASYLKDTNQEKLYQESAKNQIAVGTQYITDKYKDPCAALDYWSKNGTY